MLVVSFPTIDLSKDKVRKLSPLLSTGWPMGLAVGMA